MTTQSWIARFIPSAHKDYPIRVRVGYTDYYIDLEEAYRLKHTITMAIDDLKEASESKGDYNR